MTNVHRVSFALLAVAAVILSGVPAEAHLYAVSHQPTDVTASFDFGPRYGTTYTCRGEGGYEAQWDPVLGETETYDVIYFFAYRTRPNSTAGWSDWSSSVCETSHEDNYKQSSWGQAAVVTGNWTKGAQVQFRSRVRCALPLYEYYSSWTAGDIIAVGNTPPTAPTGLTYSPLHPTGADSITATAVGGSDIDGDQISYSIVWHRVLGNGSLQWLCNGPELSEVVTQGGQTLRLQCWTNDGDDNSTEIREVSIIVENATPTTPTSLAINPSQPRTADAITATASGSVDGDNTAVILDPITYEYQWSVKSGAIWGKYMAYDGQTLLAFRTTKGQQWRVRARACDSHGAKSGFIYSDIITIANTAPTSTRVLVSPGEPDEDDDLTASAVGSTDADGDALTYQYRWVRNGLILMDAYTRTLPASRTAPGERWKAQARAHDGNAYGPWNSSAEVTLTDVQHPPTRPTSVNVSPLTPVLADPLTATAEGSQDVDGDPISYQYEWQVSLSQAGPWTWSAITVNPLPGGATSNGQWWRVAARAHTATADSGWSYSQPVQVRNVNHAPSTPTLCTLTPAAPVQGDLLIADGDGSIDPDGDQVFYWHEFQVDPEGDGTWEAWADWPSLPTNDLPPGAKIRARVKATDGTLFSGWRASAAVTLRGLVESIAPADGASGVYRWPNVVVTFRRPVLEDAAAALFLRAGDVEPERTASWTTPGTVLRIRPTTPLAGLTDHQVGFRSVITRQDGGDVTTGFASSFTTNDGAALTNWRPRGEGVARSMNILVTFDRPMNRVSVQDNVVIAPAVGSGVWTWSEDNKTATFNPDNALAAGTSYTVTVRRACMTSRRVAMGQDQSWRFTTELAAGAAGMVTASAADTAQGAAISVVLSSAAEVQVSISNMAGRAIAVLPEAGLPAGVSSLAWNGRTLSGVKAPAGMYLVTVEARNDSGGKVTALTPLQLR
ncbi:MAG: Ig-like domain-containing protein [Armatimonadia bacterium]